MEYAFLGGPGSGATLRLDYRAFAYAGKFVVGAPGKAVLRTPDGSPAVPEWEPDEPLPPTVESSEFAGEVFDVDARPAVDVGGILVGEDDDFHGCTSASGEERDRRSRVREKGRASRDRRERSGPTQIIVSSGITVFFGMTTIPSRM